MQGRRYYGAQGFEIDAGELRHLVQINKLKLGAPGPTGSKPKSYEFFTEAYAKIEAGAGASAREIEFAQSFAATVTHRVTIRYQAGILPTMQVVYGSRTFVINGIDNVQERNTKLILYCTEIVQ